MWVLALIFPPPKRTFGTPSVCMDPSFCQILDLFTFCSSLFDVSSRAGWNKKGQNYRQPFGTIHSPDAASHSNTSIRSNNSQNRPQSAPRGRSNVSSTGVYQSPGPGHYNVPTSSLRINTSQPTAAASSSSSLHNQFFEVNPVAFGRTVNPMEVSMNAMGGLGGSSSSMLQSFSSRPLTPVH